MSSSPVASATSTRRGSSGSGSTATVQTSTPAASASVATSSASSKTSLLKKKKPMTEVERLELENKKMEERLTALRDTLMKQKEKRGNLEYLWKAGDRSRGSLKSYASEVLAKKNPTKTKRTRFGGLGEEADAQRKTVEDFGQTIPSSTEKEAAKEAPAMPMWRVPTALGMTPSDSSTSSSTPRPQTPATASRAAQINKPLPPHLTSYIPPPSYTSSRPTSSATRQPPQNQSRALNTNVVDDDEDIDGVGMGTSGQFNEEESHRSFLDALAEWRKGRSTESGSTHAAEGKHDTTSTATGTNELPKPELKDLAKAIVEYSSAGPGSLSYMERLLLHRYRMQNQQTFDSISSEEAHKKVPNKPAEPVPKPAATSEETSPKLIKDDFYVITDNTPLKPSVGKELIQSGNSTATVAVAAEDITTNVTRKFKEIVLIEEL
ncbi:hypothetical protein HK102_013484 [Quaeritorhiza haematococci]|nr:hypothetical protein HK102_013484 [Quaeritorhiza haematococci]